MVPAVDRGAKHRQVERIAGSSVLQGSESLCQLLRYLAEHSLNSPGTPIKEHQIATEVLGRSADFDPRLDSTVRVQTSRLRTKLGEYYADLGAHDEWIIEIPKGSYMVFYHQRTVPPAPAVAPPVPSAPGPRRNVPALLALAGALGGLGGFGLTQWRQSVASATSTFQDVHPALRAFWREFTDTAESPLVVYSNAEFVGRPETGMRYRDSAKDHPKAVLDHYTGVGEVLAIHELDRVFDAFGHPLRVRRGRVLSWDEARSSDVIFIGSPSENLSLREVLGAEKFVFRRMRQPGRQNDLAIVNTSPDPGETPYWLATDTLPIVEDFALIEMLPGLNPNRWVLVLAGTTTFGTQAAAEFVARPAQIERLLEKLSGSPTGPVSPFAAVVKVKVSGGVPVQSTIVALKRIK